MTIRQYLQRRSDRHARAAFVLICVGVLAAFWSLLEAPCPHCGKPMGRVGFWLAIGAMRDAVSSCPNCQFDVDAALPELPKS